MKNATGLMGLLLVLVISGSAAAPDRITQRRLWKAEEILQTDTEVVTDGAVGYGGAFPEANWALSVILAQDPDPLVRLQRIAEHSTPEGTLMCLRGIKFLDPVAFEKATKTWRATLIEPKNGIQILSGCIGERVPVTRALAIVASWDKQSFLRYPIPSLEETIRVRKTPP